MDQAPVDRDRLEQRTADDGRFELVSAAAMSYHIIPD